VTGSPSTPSRRGTLLVALTLALAGPALLPPATGAADGGLVLATHVLSSVTADLDADGANEVVAVVANPEDPAVLSVQAWSARGESWVSLGQAVVQHWDAAASELRTAHLGVETAGLLVMRNGGQPRVMVVVGRQPSDGLAPAACCLSLANVRLAAGGLNLEPIRHDLGSAETVMAVDLEADGRDELVLSTPIAEGDGPWRNEFRLVRQVSDGYVAEPIDIGEGIAYLNFAADIDGLPGDELLFMSEDNSELIRAVASDAGLRIDRAPMTEIFERRSGGWIAGVADGRLIFVTERGIVTARWSRDGLTGVAETPSSGPFPSVWTIGSGADTRLIEAVGMDAAMGDELGMRVYTLDLDLEVERDAPPAVNQLWRAMQEVQTGAVEMPDIYPQLGPIPGGLPDGRPAFLGLAHVVAINADGSTEVHEAAQMAGGQLMGLAGPGSSWLVRGTGWFPGGATVWLGGLGSDAGQIAALTVAVGPVEAVLAPADGDLDVTLDGATVLQSAEGPRVFAAPGGFRATVAADPGTAVVATIGNRANVVETVSSATTVDIDLAGARDANARDTAGILVVGPLGIARSASWDVTILREPPELSAASSFELFEGHATLSGDVAFGTSITVDGRPVEPGSDGSFEVQIAASPWPRDVMVVARDPIGQEVARNVEVVGIVDLRALPWLPSVIAATLGAGIVLFLRTPVLRSDERLVPDGDGRLEEIEG